MDYTKKFDKIAYDVLSSKGLQSKIHVCVELGCTKTELESWIKAYPSFKYNIEMGLIVGEMKYRDKLAKLSLRNSGKINTKLLLLLGGDVYGLGEMQEDSQPIVINNFANNQDVEEQMKKRGIPIPQIGIPDAEDPDEPDI